MMDLHQIKMFKTIKKKQKFNPQEVRFTKVLTKYSTEYNNALFIQGLSQELMMDKNDIIGSCHGIGVIPEVFDKYKDSNIVQTIESRYARGFLISYK